MREAMYTTALVIFIALCDRAVGYKQATWNYFFWGLLIFAAVCYTQSLHSHPVVPTYEETLLIDEPMPPERLYFHDCKWIPMGVPPSHITEDGVPTQACINLIYGTGQKEAYRNLHTVCRKLQLAEDSLHDMCFLCPDMIMREHATAAFLGTLASLAPGVIHTKFAVTFIALASHYGIMFRNHWDKMAEQNSLIKWYSHAAQHYADHINKEKW